MFSLKDICIWTGGELVLHGKGNEDDEIKEVSRDSRKAFPAKSLFVVFKGEKYDAHDFLTEAEKNGAAACLVERVSADISIPQIKVDSTFKAVQAIAKAYRRKLQIPVLAITGSSGKTTTKNFCAAVLAKKYKVAYTKGNLNNHIGLPMSMLSIRPDDEIAVFEIGMNRPGEIEALASVCEPTAGIITNVGTAHVEFFGSKNSIAKEKSALGAALPESGFLVIPKKDEYADLLAEATKARVIAVDGDDPSCALFIEKLKKGGMQASHILMSALLAAAAGREYGVPEKDIIESLLGATNDKGRFAFKQIKINTKGLHSSIDIIDDTYNANPDSVCASLRATADMYPNRRKILVLGKLMEQGEFEEEGYKRIVEQAAQSGFAQVIFIDIPYKYSDVIYVKDHQECVDILMHTLTSTSDIVLFKGSRASATEKVIELLENTAK